MKSNVPTRRREKKSPLRLVHVCASQRRSGGLEMLDQMPPAVRPESAVRGPSVSTLSSVRESDSAYL